MYRERMAYPSSFHRLVLIGTMYGVDVWNTTLSIVPSGGSAPAVSEELLADVADAVGLWFDKNIAGGGVGTTSSAPLTSIKLNRINTAGRYQDAEVREHVYSAPISGSGGAAVMPAQVAVAVTLRGENERLRAGKGRMYFPFNDYSIVLGTDGRIVQGNAAAMAQRFHQFLQNIAGVYIDSGVGLLPGIASKSGTGAFQVLSYVSVGRVPDTIRSRRSKLDEAPERFPAAA
jgi:hypothetical protein